MPNVDDKSQSSGSFGYLLVLVLFALVFVLILPLIGMLYMDTLVVKREARQQMEKVEKLRKQIEEAQKLFDLLFEEKFENRPCRWAQIVCIKTSKIIQETSN